MKINLIRTSKPVAQKASKVLRSNAINKTIKTIVASALVNRKNKTK